MATPVPRLPRTPAGAMAEGGLLASAFAGPSWDRWRAILRAAYGEVLAPAELALFREVAERDPPVQAVRELWAVVGRGGGKDSIASAIACCAAMRDYRRMLRPGEKACVMCLAADRTQAQIAFRYIAEYFETIPLLRALVESQTDDTLTLANGVEIVVATNSYRAVRGRTIVAAVCDEVGFWRDEASATPDVETYAALLPALGRVSGSMLIGISSAYARKGLLYDKWRAHYGKADDDVLVVRGTTAQFNPTYPQRLIDAELARDYERNSAEYLSEWRSDIADFIDGKLLDAATDYGVFVRPPMRGISYVAFADPSGGRGDSFALAIVHVEGDTAILDCLYERRVPFNPENVLIEVAELLRSYGVSVVTGDKYAAEWVVSGFARHGIRYENATRDRSQLYVDALPLFASGRVRLIEHQRMFHQFAGLERRTSRFGRDRVGHPERSGSHDDLCNAVAGALTLVSLDQRPSLNSCV